MNRKTFISTILGGFAAAFGFGNGKVASVRKTAFTDNERKAFEALLDGFEDELVFSQNTDRHFNEIWKGSQWADQGSIERKDRPKHEINKVTLWRQNCHLDPK